MTFHLLLMHDEDVAAIRQVLEHVSVGRGGAMLGRYPDASARRGLAALEDALYRTKDRGRNGTLEAKILPRGAGKTNQAMGWVLAGERTDGYPGWTRVLVVPTTQEHDRLKRVWWGKTEDFDHRVYSFEDWQGARMVSPSTEVRVDNLEHVLHLGIPGHFTGFTMTATPW